MSNQDIFDILADTEEKLFYALCGGMGNVALDEAHEAAKKALEAFAKATGCHNN